MSTILDTHAFLWFIAGDDQLSSTARSRIESEESTCLLSVGSLWEMAIKVSLEKLEVPLPLTRLVREHVWGNGFEILSIDAEHLDVQLQLRFHHRDPFDRLIISQAISENMPVITDDAKFESYDVACIWG